MASKNLGAVIQRAISDGAFRRQLQSDPAAALRGFNLSPDEVAAIRSGDSGKLMSLGVDQRMSKAFTVGGGLLGATRSTTSDLGAGASSSAIATDATAGTREGIVGDPTSGTRDALTTGNLSGTRSVNDVAPFEGNVNAAAVDGGAGASGGGMLSADDNYAVSSRMADAGDATSIRPINDVAPFDGGVNAAATEGGEFLGGDARLDPGTDSAHGFIPSDSADVQRELLDGAGHGDALGSTGGGGNTSS